MKSYRSYIDAEYVSRGLSPDYNVDTIYQYAAYKDGTVAFFDNIKDARNYSSNTEMGIVNKEELAKYSALIKEIYKDAHNKWYQENIYQYWKDRGYSDELIQLCYGYSYERNHSCMDDVASGMSELIDFADKVEKLYLSQTECY